MGRGVGEVEAVQRLVPEGLLPVVEFTTRLGDVSTLVAVTVVAALLLGRDRGAHLFGVVIGGFALLAGLKAALALSRPSETLHLIETATTGFPSGHALGATLVYGGLALALDTGTRRARIAAVVPLVVAVSLSRIVLGVHYLIDVVVGVAVATTYLWLVERYTRGDPTRAFVVATVLSAFALAAGIAFGPTPRTACLGTVCLDRDTAAVAAASAAALIVWTAPNRPIADRTLAWAVPLCLGVGGAGLVWVDSALFADVVTAALGAAVVVVALVGYGIALADRVPS
jgi:hypothetical protein